MKQSTRRIFHWEPEFTKRLIRIALPIAIQNLVAASAHIIDALMIAGYGEVEDVCYAAVTSAGRYSFFFQLLLFGAASGTSIFISQFWGNKNKEGIHRVMALCLRITVGIALLFMLGTLVAPDAIMGLFLQPGVSRALGGQYLMIVGPSYVLAAIDIVYSNTLRSTGKPAVAMYAGIASILTNTVFNYGLIYGRLGMPEMGVQGAALATVLAAGVSLAINMTYSYVKKQPGGIRGREFRMPPRAFSVDYIKRVLPVVINEGLWSLGITTYAMIYGKALGDVAVSAMGVYNNIEQLMTVFIFGVVNATAIMIGHAIGAGDKAEARLISWRMLLTVEVVSLVTAGLLIAFRYPILSLFTKLSAQSVASAASIILIAGCFMPFRFFNTVNIVGVLRAGGDTIFSMALDAGCVWLVGVPCVAITTLVFGWPIELIFLSTFLEEFVKIALGLPRFLGNKWMNNLTTIGAR